jgi:hypothetical protein
MGLPVNPNFKRLVAKSIFTLGINAFKMKKGIVFDVATSSKSGHEPLAVRLAVNCSKDVMLMR